jgi:hypothetical protein
MGEIKEMGKTIGVVVGIKLIQYASAACSIAILIGGTYFGLNYLSIPRHSVLLTHSLKRNETEVKIKVYPYQVLNTIQKSHFKLKNGRECLESKEYSIMQTNYSSDAFYGETTFILNRTGTILKEDILNHMKECKLQVDINSIYREPFLRLYRNKTTKLNVYEYDFLASDERA